MDFLISLKLLRAWGASIPWGMLHGLLYHSAVFICSACPSFPSAWSFYVRKTRDSLLAHEGSAGLRSHGTHARLSDKRTVNAGRDSCALAQAIFHGKSYYSKINFLSFKSHSLGVAQLQQDGSWWICFLPTKGCKSKFQNLHCKLCIWHAVKFFSNQSSHLDYAWDAEYWSYNILWALVSAEKKIIMHPHEALRVEVLRR